MFIHLRPVPAVLITIIIITRLNKHSALGHKLSGSVKPSFNSLKIFPVASDGVV